LCVIVRRRFSEGSEGDGENGKKGREEGGVGCKERSLKKTAVLFNVVRLQSTRCMTRAWVVIRRRTKKVGKEKGGKEKGDGGRHICHNKSCSFR
jgi:hypothetical protein